MSAENNDRPTVLTIAGFDPSGGAGIIADIRTFVHFGCRATAAITSLTFQNSQGVFGAAHETAESLRAQILPIVQESRIDAVKVGMLPTAELVREVAGLIREEQLPAPVVDPVMQSSSGHRLMEDEAFEVFVTELLPLSRLITPNIPEAEKLAGQNILDEEDMRQVAARIRELGARAVLIKGGHLGTQASRLLQSSSEAAGGPAYPTSEGAGGLAYPTSEGAGGPAYPTSEGAGGLAYPSEAIDLLDDQGEVTRFRGEWIDGPSVRGTGCMLSSAIAAGLARKMPLSEAVATAKQFVASQIQICSQDSEVQIPDSRFQTGSEI